MNEIFFLTQILLNLGFTILAARTSQQALTALIALNAVLANFFVVKQMELFGLTVTCSDVFAVGCILGLNLMQEYFGKEAAKKTTRISFLAMIFFILISQIHLWYVPAAVDTSHAAFYQILKFTPRIVIASVAVFYIVQKFDIFFFGILKKLRLGIRIGISLFVSQLIDTILFSFAGLYGIAHSILDVIIMSFTIKCLIILTSVPFFLREQREKAS